MPPMFSNASPHRRIGFRLLAAFCPLTLFGVADAFGQPSGGVCLRTITADVVALDQSFFWNRLGVSQPHGMIFALLEDVVGLDGGVPSAGNARLRDGKRPRPITLRMNSGDCLEIHFQNFLSADRVNPAQPMTRTASIRAMGMQLVNSIMDDGSYVGANENSLAAPGGGATYTYFAEREGTHHLYSAAATIGGEGDGGSLSAGLFGAVNVQPQGAEWYRSQVSRSDLDLATFDFTPAGHPIIDYDAVYPAGHPQAGRPIFKMLDAGNQIRHTDLTAIITGPGRGNFPPGTYTPNPIYPDRHQPFREFTIIYHGEIGAVQAFDLFNDPVMGHTLDSVTDGFAINYGSGGIGAEIISNRFGVGPMWDCNECKYEEFFLSAWALGDPAMIVDIPANADQTGDGTVTPGPKATVAYYPDDPSNVYHSYIGDHVKFRLSHGGPKEEHLHHLHAHQWLYTPDSDNSAYLDSQAIGPGSAYTLEIPYRGSGNRNQTVGDSIFHCHFYPHFAQGMWSLWRTHDVFEHGTVLDIDGRPVPGARALPDGEIVTGTPIPSIVPIPGLVMAPMPEADIDIVQVPGQPGGQVQINGAGNPGFPFFIPGVAGHRPPHPPMDTIHNGGLPRHVATGGHSFSIETRLDFTKELETLSALELPEGGTAEELTAMAFHAQRLHPSFTTDGTAGNYQLNGLPAAPGAPYADPCLDDVGNPVGSPRIYKAANIQLDAILNKSGWHFPQTRMIALWEDVGPTLDGTRPPEPLFFRANTDDCIEYHHTNLVPNMYEMDDFQVRTPTDILGQHIHLVKFDVTSSDGSGNGWNYEDGTFSPDEVRERIAAIRLQNACTPTDSRNGTFECPLAVSHPFFGGGPGGEWIGAQTTVQRWYADNVLNMAGEDRTLRTVFTHDHYGPSTHQQAGLYAGLLVEPKNSVWRHPETGVMMGSRGDGGPTGFRADILTADPADSYREFMLEFADFQLAYKAGNSGFPDPVNAINPPRGEGGGGPGAPCPGGVPPPCPEAISAIDIPVVGHFGHPGTMSVNYRNEPIGLRLLDPATQQQATGDAGDMSHVYRSITRADPALNVQPNFYPPLTGGVQGTDPFTPLLRAYENDKVQIRTLVGAQEELHNLSIHGIKWLYEPSDPNSGYRNSQPTGISEHFELEFTVPPSDGPEPFSDYLYMPDASTLGLVEGLWGIMRAYDGDVGLQSDLLPLPNNPLGAAPHANPQDFNGICPIAAPLRQYNVTATTAAQALPLGTLVYNPRQSYGGPIDDPSAMMYVRSEDLDINGQLIPGVPVEPLILRAAAGDCIEVTLFNGLDPAALPFQGPAMASTDVGLHAQLVSYDVNVDDGANVGFNPVQTVPLGQSRTYRWYAGNIVVNPDGTRTGIPVEFGSACLLPSDPKEHARKGAMGALIIEPEGSTWVEDADSRASATVTKADATIFRDFVLMIQDTVDLKSPIFALGGGDSPNPEAQFFGYALNYRTETMWQRMGMNPDSFTYIEDLGNIDMTNSLSNVQVGGDPVTPVFKAQAGTPVRFRVLYPGGSSERRQVFHIHGHIWEEEPYINNSTEIGHNPLSEWQGSRARLGPTSHFDAVLKNGAGGAFGVPGDYLFRTHASVQLDGGLWGILRVGRACASDLDCDDGIYCNGQEWCDPDFGCQPGEPIVCNDGVPCTADTCNEATQSCESALVDSDGDGVHDGCDNCPNDPNKIDPGLCGCGAAETDSDGDTVPNCIDHCPGFHDLIDTDGDTVADGCDNCPGVPNHAQLDSNGDGIGDACDGSVDLCPADPNKTSPGICGCGVPDSPVDTDGDGIADCNDVCPGFNDLADADGDGVPDDCDNCLLVPNPDQLDGNGDGVGDVCVNHLVEVGPMDPAIGFPQWYRDSNGFILGDCLDANDPLCGIDPALDLPDPASPISFPDNFPEESFWWFAEAVMPTHNGGQALVFMGIERAFGGAGSVVNGQQISFARIRIRADNLLPGALYTVTHPFGVETFISTGGGVRGINFTEDLGGLPGDFDFVMGGRIGPFLIWDPAESPPPAGFVGDPTIPHTVLGSPFGTNVFRIEGPDVGGPGVDMIETNLFYVMGKTNALDSTPICLNDADCDDGVFCNGIETCVNGVCQPGAPFNCNALDIDGDGDFSGADVNAMIAVLMDAPQAPEHVFRADTNGDGLNNGEDIQPFLDAMFGM